MAYQQTKKLSTAEKKLQALRTQLYGKGEVQIHQTPTFHSQKDTSPSTPISHQSTSSSTLDVSFLRHDLLKILLLAALAIGAQLLIYLSLQKGLKVPGLG
ncbi:MAG: hypothetical protein V1808_02385 [Candidatus Daviesbacteria bacterium]